MIHSSNVSLAGLPLLVAGLLLGDTPPAPSPKPEPIRLQAKPGAPGQPITIQAQPLKPATPAPPASTGPAGTMEVPETMKDFGTVDRGTELKHVFSVKNVGKYPLNIEAKAG